MVSTMASSATLTRNVKRRARALGRRRTFSSRPSWATESHCSAGGVAVLNRLRSISEDYGDSCPETGKIRRASQVHDALGRPFRPAGLPLVLGAAGLATAAAGAV